MSFSVRRVGPTFAAEISGVDLSNMDEETWRALHRAFLEHKVISVPGQSLTAAQFYSFGERFGVVEPHTVTTFHHSEQPGITLLSNRVEMGRPKGIRDAGSHWHSDYSYKKVPSNATMLYAIEVPPTGGDTLFADLAAAYAALPDDIRRKIDGRYARHHYRWTSDQNHPESRWKLLNEAERGLTPEVVHPIVPRHPETGEKSIFVFPGITSGMKGVVDMDDKESEALLDTLYRHCADERFQFRYNWKLGDVVVWDNRATMHCATTDILPPDQFRTMWRINTRGTVPISA